MNTYTQWDLDQKKEDENDSAVDIHYNWDEENTRIKSIFTLYLG